MTTNNLEDWTYVKPRTSVFPRGLILEMAVRLAYRIPGNIIEFGVAEGGSTRVIRSVANKCERDYPGSNKKIYACDSFKGLPEKYENAEVGAFACEPPQITGVELVIGYFNESLTPELAQKVGPIALASLDADLYSSTQCALRWMQPNLRTGSLLLFDEFIGEKESEKRALEDWLAESGMRAIKIADFMREPSGWGSIIDSRTIYQIVGEKELELRRPSPSFPVRAARSLKRRLIG